MSKLQQIPTPQAIPLWNNFTSKLKTPPPFSFNPSLFNFFKVHFNWKPYYILLSSKGEVCAVFPIIDTGKAMVSLPHFSYGGILFSDNCGISNINIILEKTIKKIVESDLAPGFYEINIDEKESNNKQSVKTELEKKTNNKFLIRTLDNSINDSNTSKATSLLELPANKDLLWKNLNTNLRRKIGKASKSGITFKSGGLELLDDFYGIYSKNISKLGSLNYGKNFITDLLNTYSYGNIRIFVAYINDVPVGSSLMASYNGFHESMFFASNKEARKYYVSDLLHWEMITYSMETNNLSGTKNKGVYSFGRSTLDSGVHKYKSHWPVIDHPIYQSSNIPDIRKQNWLLVIWSKLPFFISSPLGSRFIKHIY